MGLEGIVGKKAEGENSHGKESASRHVTSTLSISSDAVCSVNKMFC